MVGDSITLRTLYAGVAVPFLYFGVQVVAAPFFPEFSFVGTTASELGSDLSEQPAVFNYGTMLQGIACFVASIGFFLAYRRLGIHPILAWSTSIALAIAGLGSLRAGYYPIPDPRHGGHPAFLISVLSLPLLFTAALWKRGQASLRAYLVANLVLLAVMVPIMSGMSGLDTHTYRGLFQRIFALTVFPPIGVAAYVLARRIRALPETVSEYWQKTPVPFVPPDSDRKAGSTDSLSASSCYPSCSSATTCFLTTTRSPIQIRAGHDPS
jgi:hypothetical membrane protein